MKYTLKQIKENENGGWGWLDFFSKIVTNILTWINVNFVKLTPNQITLFSLPFGLLSGYFFFNGYLLGGAIFYFVRYCLDCVDGRTARVTGTSSNFGAFLDNYSGIISFFFVVIGFTFGQYVQTKDIFWLFSSPIILFLYQFHFIEVSIFTAKKKDFSKETEKRIKIERWAEFLKKKGILEPFNTIDMRHLMFLFAPIVGLFIPILKEIVLFLLSVIIIKEIFWFFYYRKKLMEQDKSELEEKNKQN